jgi:hypothetical protein
MTKSIRIMVPRGRSEDSITVTWSFADHENPHPDGARRCAEALRILDELGSAKVQSINAINRDAQARQDR